MLLFHSCHMQLKWSTGKHNEICQRYAHTSWTLNVRFVSKLSFATHQPSIPPAARRGFLPVSLIGAGLSSALISHHSDTNKETGWPITGLRIVLADYGGVKRKDRWVPDIQSTFLSPIGKLEETRMYESASEWRWPMPRSYKNSALRSKKKKLGRAWLLHRWEPASCLAMK